MPLRHAMATPFAIIDIIDVDQEPILGHIYSMVAGSVVDESVIRHTTFLQGCQLKWLSRHNRDTWDVNAGQLFTVAKLADKIFPFATFLDKSHRLIMLDIKR